MSNERPSITTLGAEYGHILDFLSRLATSTFSSNVQGVGALNVGFSKQIQDTSDLPQQMMQVQTQISSHSVRFLTQCLLEPKPGQREIVVYDSNKLTFTRASNSFNGAPSDGDSQSPSISGDGRYIVFSSEATNLVENDNNGTSDIFLYDRLTKVTTLVSDAINTLTNLKALGIL